MSRHSVSFLIMPQPILTLHLLSWTSRSPVYHRDHLNRVISIVVATRASQTAHLLILPFTTILYVLQKSNRMWRHTFHAYFRLRATGLLIVPKQTSRENGSGDYSAIFLVVLSPQSRTSQWNSVPHIQSIYATNEIGLHLVTNVHSNQDCWLSTTKKLLKNSHQTLFLMRGGVWAWD